MLRLICYIIYFIIIARPKIICIYVEQNKFFILTAAKRCFTCMTAEVRVYTTYSQFPAFKERSA